MANESNDRGRVAQVAGKVAEQVTDRLAPLRVAGWRALGAREGAVVRAIRKVNDALGRPLAPADELEDRKAFARGYRGDAAPAAPASPAAAPPAPAARTTGPAPVVIYYMDKQRRDADKLALLLDGHGIPYTRASLEDDPAAQAAVRRDSKGLRLPLVFIAGDCIGGLQQLTNLGAPGLKKLVFGT